MPCRASRRGPASCAARTPRLRPPAAAGASAGGQPAEAVVHGRLRAPARRSSPSARRSDEPATGPRAPNSKLAGSSSRGRGSSAAVQVEAVAGLERRPCVASCARSLGPGTRAGSGPRTTSSTLRDGRRQGPSPSVRSSQAGVVPLAARGPAAGGRAGFGLGQATTTARPAAVRRPRLRGDLRLGAPRAVELEAARARAAGRLRKRGGPGAWQAHAAWRPSGPRPARCGPPRPAAAARRLGRWPAAATGHRSWPRRARRRPPRPPPRRAAPPAVEAGRAERSATGRPARTGTSFIGLRR